MDKIVRNAVKACLIKDNKIVVVKYKKDFEGYIDIPGGKIEDNETKEAASIREFKEETGITITKQHYIGHTRIEYPNIIFDLSFFLVDEYDGVPQKFYKNQCMWIDFDDLFKERKVFSTIEVLKHLKDNFDIDIKCDSNHNITYFKVN